MAARNPAKMQSWSSPRAFLCFLFCIFWTINAKIRHRNRRHCALYTQDILLLVLPSSTTEERLGAHVFFRVRGGRCGRDTSCRTCCTQTPRWGVVFRLSLRLSFPWQLRCDSFQTLRQPRDISSAMRVCWLRRSPRFSYSFCRS